MPQLTNATKAQVIAVVNGALGLLIAFGVTLTDAQQVAITTTVNALLALWVGATYKASPRRTPDEPAVAAAPSTSPVG
jgi:hypothetical protein